MKTPIPNLPHLARLAVLVLLSILHLQLSTIFAQDTLITYQGRLNDNGNPANGLYDLRFSLYDNSSGGLPVGNNVIQTAPVTNGLFTSSINFGASFAGANRWLQLEVRTNGSGAGYTVLDPRQRVTAAPYSIYALAAATAATAGSASNVVSGSVVSSVNALKDNVILQAGSNVTISPSGNTLTIASAGVGGSGIWSVLNNNAYYNAGNVGIGTTAPSLYGHGGTGRILEINNNGTAMHSQSHLMLYSGVNSLMDSAMGSVTWAQPGGMAAYIGAQTRGTTPNSPSATLTFGTRKTGDAGPSPRMVITEEGNVGIGTISPFYKLAVVGNVGFGTTPVSGRGVVSVKGGNATGLWASGTGTGVTGEGGSVGVYGYTGAGSGVYGNSGSGAGVRAQSDSGNLFEGYANTFSGERLVFRVRNDGQVRSDVGFTTPGADFAEWMSVDETSNPATEPFQPGDVLVINPETGKLRKSNLPYSTLVAGIYSTKPGFLGNQGIEEVDPAQMVPVALVGVVPTKVTAENGAIHPGDMLTTSSTPGYAMKASPVLVGGVEIYRTGTILGKAMSALKEGNGMVQVLVTLQ